MIHIGDIEEKILPSVLVVEDEDDMRQNLAELLSEEFKVFTAANAEQALRVYYNEQFRLNVVLLDIRLPDVSGIQVLNKMRNINLNPDIIMVTALNDIQTAVEAMRHGAYDYVTKPFFAGDLVATIKRALEKKDYSRKLKELTDRFDHERIAAEHRHVLFQELQMKGRIEGRDLSGEEKTLFHFPVLSEEDYDYEKLKEKLESELKTRVEIGEGAMVLVVGGDVELCNLLKDTYVLENTSSGHEVIELLGKKRFELVLLDISIPDMDGMELLSRINKEYPLVDVIVVTSIKETETAVKAMKIGAYDYIAYPYVEEDVKLSVKRVLEKRVAKTVLEKLIEKYKEVYLSFEPRLKLFKELYHKRKKEKKKIAMQDFYTFFPEYKEESYGLEVRVDFPEFSDDSKLENFIRKLREKSS